MSAGDVITSAPSAWGAACATSAVGAFAFPNPVAGTLAMALAAVLDSAVSDPAQIWSAGDRYGTAAGLIRQAADDLEPTVQRVAGAGHWTESGKDAFMECRVRPYRQALTESADSYDQVEEAMGVLAEAYTAGGIVCAFVGGWGAALAKAQLLAAEGGPMISLESSVGAAWVLGRLVNSMRVLVSGLGGVSGAAATSVLAPVASKLASLGGQMATRLGLTGVGVGAAAATGAAFGIAQDIGTVSDFTHDRVPEVRWPETLPAGTPIPAGYRAASADQARALKLIGPDSIKALGKELDAGIGGTLTRAYDGAKGIEVGAPGFGGIGVVSGVGAAHVKVRDTAAAHLAAARDVTGSWLPGLRTTADNWVFAEQNRTMH